MDGGEEWGKKENWKKDKERIETKEGRSRKMDNEQRGERWGEGAQRNEK